MKKTRALLIINAQNLLWKVGSVSMFVMGGRLKYLLVVNSQGQLKVKMLNYLRLNSDHVKSRLNKSSRCAKYKFAYPSATHLIVRLLFSDLAQD